MRGRAMTSQPTYLVVPVLMAAAAFAGWPAAAAAQGTAADYARADALRARYENAAVDIAGPASTVGRTHRFWYRKSTRGIEQFMMIDAETRQTRPAFDHASIARSLSEATGNTYTAGEAAVQCRDVH
jgi:hypothetical protein